MKLHALLFALLMLIVPGIAEARSTLIYTIPAGFTDVSPGAPKANFKNLTPAFVAEATSGKFEVFAIGPKDGGAFEPRFVALASPQDAPITEIVVDDYVEEMVKGWATKRTPSTLLRRELVSLGGVRAGRVLIEQTEGGVAKRVLFYLVPDGDVTVTLIFTSDAATFDKHLPAFEAAANGTSGIVPATHRALRKTALDALRATGKVSAVPAAASPFTFSLPAGMTDVKTPGFDPALAEAAERANFAKYAIGDNGETFHAVVSEGSLIHHERMLDPIAQDLERSFAEGGKIAKVTERSLVAIGGVRAVRLVFDVTSNGTALRGLVVDIPGARHHARLTYLAAARSFSRLLPGFEASAGATIGAASPAPALHNQRSRVAFGIVFVLTIATVLLFGVNAVLRKRRPHPPPP